MSSAGRLYIESVDAIANAVAGDYRPGTLIFDMTTGSLYLQKAGVWKEVTVAI
jgi:hypothetical protein